MRCRAPRTRRSSTSSPGSARTGVGRARGARDAWAAEHGLEFGVGGTKQPFAVDLVPRLLHRHEWAELEAGLVQRARALEAFLDDVYGERADPAGRGAARRSRCCAPPAGGPRRPACPPASSARRSRASTSCATSTAAGGCSRTTCATRPASPTPSRCASCWTRCCPTCPRPAAAHGSRRRLRAAAPHRARPGAARHARRAAVERPRQRRVVRAPAARRGRGPAPRAGRRPRRRRRRGRPPPRPRGRSAPSTCGSIPSSLDLVDGTGRPIGAEILDVAAQGGVGARQPARERRRGRQGDVPVRARADRLLPRRAADPRGRPDLPHRRRPRAPGGARAGRRAGHEARRRIRRPGRADRPRRERGRGRGAAGRRSPRTRTAGWRRRSSRCPACPRSGTGCCSRGTSTSARSSTRPAGAAATCVLAPVALTRVAPDGSLVVNSSRGGGREGHLAPARAPHADR